ncbi:MAG: hypothetical protein QXU40_03985 [Candidatus Pacearchaeota archaeon]
MVNLKQIGCILIIILFSNVITYIVASIFGSSELVNFQNKIFENITKVSDTQYSREDIWKVIERQEQQLKDAEKSNREYKEKLHNLQIIIEEKDKEIDKSLKELIIKGVESYYGSKKNLQWDYTQKSVEELVEEFQKAINEEDILVAIQVLGELLNRGEKYYPKILELYSLLDELRKKLNSKIADENVAGNERKKISLLLKKQWIFENNIKLRETFEKFSEWFLEAKPDIQNSLVNSIIQKAMMDKNKVSKLYDYIKNIISKQKTETEIKTKGIDLIQLAFTDTNMIKTFLIDLNNLTSGEQVKNAIAYALGVARQVAQNFGETPFMKEIETILKENQYQIDMTMSSTINSDLKKYYELGMEEAKKSGMLRGTWSILLTQNISPTTDK